MRNYHILNIDKTLLLSLGFAEDGIGFWKIYKVYTANNTELYFKLRIDWAIGEPQKYIHFIGWGKRFLPCELPDYLEVKIKKIMAQDLKTLKDKGVISK